MVVSEKTRNREQVFRIPRSLMVPANTPITCTIPIFPIFEVIDDFGLGENETATSLPSHSTGRSSIRTGPISPEMDAIRAYCKQYKKRITRGLSLSQTLRSRQRLAIQIEVDLSVQFPNLFRKPDPEHSNPNQRIMKVIREMLATVASRERNGRSQSKPK